MQPLEYRSTTLPLELEKTSPRMLNFAYSNPATYSLFYDDVKVTQNPSKKKISF